MASIAVFPWRTEHGPATLARVMAECAEGTCEYAFGEDRGAQARHGVSVGAARPAPSVRELGHPSRQK